tara:strand:- start:563 stop:913 length:351 start_codon:yes stop_codon:yes gene_type:complete
VNCQIGGNTLAFFELREYRIKDGKMDEWVDFMEKEIIPFQVGKGMVVVGSFVSEEEEDLYIWIRRFESEDERENLYEAVYQDPMWTDDISDRVGAIMDRERIVVRRILPTSRSVTQ